MSTAAQRNAWREEWRYRHGYDERAVELFLAGVRVKLFPDQRAEIVRVMHARRVSDAVIAASVGMSVRQVLRIRRRLGLHGWERCELEQEHSAYFLAGRRK